MSTFGEDLIQSLEEALAHAKGGGPAIVHAPIAPREVRKQAKLTQAQMAPLMGMSLSGYRKWEHGTRRVSGPAATLLCVIQKEPEAVRRALMHSRDTNELYPQDWKSRREIPNPQVKDAADQYEHARLILSGQSPGTGVVLPLMNATGMAIELYLKCLTAEVIHVPEQDIFRKGIREIDEVKPYRVYAQANTGGHRFKLILREIEDGIRCRLETSYATETKRKLQEDLSKIGGVLVRSRYPYEPENDPTGVDLPTLMSLSAFLCRFVADLEPRETIQ